MIKLSAKEKCYIYLWLASLVYILEVALLTNRTIGMAIWIPAMLLLLVTSVAKLIVWDKRELFILCSIVFILAIGFVYGDVLLSSVHWQTAFCFVTQLCAVLLCSRGRISKKAFDWIFFLAIAISTAFAIMSFFPIAYKVTTEGRVWYTIYYVFNLGNSNLTGIYLLCLFIVLLINLRLRKHKILLSVLIVFVGYMLYKTNARSCIFAGIAIVLLYFFFKKRMPRFIIWLCMAFPLAFPIIYNWLLRLSDGEFIFLGKKFFSGREHVYEEYLSKLNSWFHYLLGNFGESSFQNAHNGPLAIYASIGAIGLLLTYSLYWRAINRINSNGTIVSTICVACLLGIFIQSSGEAAALLGGFPGIVFVSTIFLLANYQEPKQGDTVAERTLSS